MKSLIKKLSVVLSLIMAFGLVGCSNSCGFSYEPKKIAVLLSGEIAKNLLGEKVNKDNVNDFEGEW